MHAFSELGLRISGVKTTTTHEDSKASSHSSPLHPPNTLTPTPTPTPNRNPNPTPASPCTLYLSSQELGVTFQLTYEAYGAPKTVELKPGPS